MNEKPLPLKGPIGRPEDMVEVGGPVRDSKVHLRVHGDALIPAEVTRLLGVEPTQSCTKGDVIPGKRRDRVARFGGWVLDGDRPRTEDVEEQVRALLARVTDDLAVWQSLAAQYRIDVFCGVFLDDWNRGFELSPEVMRMLSDRGLTIGFDIYGS